MVTNSVEYTHPDVLTIGIRDGWADPITDPTRIDWTARQARAAIPFKVIEGRPVNPCQQTGIRYGRNELGHWGEALAADAMVTATDPDGHRWLVMVERADGYGWALPGGHVEPGEDPVAAAIRELHEETGLHAITSAWTALPARYVPDPRASDEAWMVTVPVRTHLGTYHRDDPPEVVGADDAARAAWVRADTYEHLVEYLTRTYAGEVFPAHRRMLADALVRVTQTPCPDCDGEGQVLTAQVVGRLRRRTVEQYAACLTCSGTGHAAPEPQ
ncbi:NUDIX domain-containing protein [Planotetraspora sp. A-T 1434]|uniref:NUDIX domain-containing protein n=1 Tax=Planotetraspora sp. A-T 1434 TaxID=2979219 RepID=UPI0021C0CC1F|nr:NUDIX domain-containing protein [Planotetraspora sp. A-T 1434]MCT9929566.1 NUDIX domain-containing protein [Planotetraspora sp. A-T 1434]